ncbi:hypothetical protein [Pedobacter jeongneungensis]|uniref:hypothetical protein n=1 Tax=Pedobacter jeongneungensis TaxID=947309 RepID=UPI0004682022|nr:hypothetical protein [Pedobacter jeongneungensis]
MKSKNAIKTFSMLFICLAIFGSAKAQDSTKVEQPTEVKSLNKIRLNLLSLHYEREQKIGKLTTAYVGAGVAGTLSVEYHYNYISGGKTNTYFDLAPNLYAGIRKYYHFENRIKKGKKTINNASNYFGLDVASYFSPLIKGGNMDQYNVVDFEIGITPQWGFQRSIGKKTNFELSLGPTMRINKYQTYYGVDGRIGFSFLL